VLLLALSCLQGRPMRAAFDELAALADSVQLTPGNHPTPGFAAHVAAHVSAHRTMPHHGFSFTARRTRVWGDDGRALVADRSVHPPPLTDAWLPDDTVVHETMYPGMHLGDAVALRAAMARGLRLAVDVAHLHIQRATGALDEATLARVYDYDRIAEVHVSASDGRRDLHAPLAASSFGLGWARARLAAGTPVVLECYMHRMARDDRARQVALVRAA
jgi:hypothetical protein